MTSEESFDENTSFNWEDFLQQNRIPIVVGLVGLIFVGLGIFFIKDNKFSSTKVEVIENTDGSLGEKKELIVEVSGAVENPGVYKLKSGDRVEDALIAAGGISAGADRVWMEKMVNRAAKITDGQKIYIISTDEQSDVLSAKNSEGDQSGSSNITASGERSVNINSASQKELEELWGIGPVTAQNIIEQRPYSNVEELLQKKILKSNVYERNLDYLTVY